jgi:hypothetical protein
MKVVVKRSFWIFPANSGLEGEDEKNIVQLFGGMVFFLRSYKRICQKP